MNKNFKHIHLPFMVMITFIMLVVIACNKSKMPASDAAATDEYYTCSMDPQVVEYKPGNCPICHMKLIKVKKNNLKAGQIKLSDQQIKLANITYDTLRVRELAKEITLTGKVTVDQNLSTAISARVQGRIENLSVKNIGDYISSGQILYKIYSEELNAAQQEYIMALQQIKITSDRSITGQLIESAKNKLLLAGMSEAQIDQIKTSGQVSQFVPVYSGTAGFVSELNIAEGNYVSVGTTLFRFASLNTLWVEAQVYLPYLPYLHEGTQASISIPSASDKVFPGKVIFIDPQVQSPERFVLARFQISNPSHEIKPGMLANITLQTELKKSLVLPIDAIIQDSQGSNVWVRNEDGIFENKMVKTGIQNSRSIEIVDGLMQGDIVVITGAYLINSEYIFKKGANPMEGHGDMPGMKM